LKLLTFDELKPKKGIPYCREHARRLGDQGKFPKAIKLGYGERAKIAFVEEEIDAWLVERAAARDAGGAA
jgi:predicted DNA-binding transcriptional regulator AlpA